MTSPFAIELLASWQTCPDPIHDTCLTGALRVTINGTVVADDREYGVAESARALMRTITRDHGPNHRVVNAPYLLSHDCGFPDFACSNFGTTWSVTHRDGLVRLAHVESYSAHPVARGLSFPEADVEIPLADYRTEVLRFADDARNAYFASGERRILDREQQRLYAEFWREYDRLVSSLAEL